MIETIKDRVRWESKDSVATITLTRPEAGNGFDLLMAEAISDAAQRAHDSAASGAIRAVIIAAEGPSFSVGGDLQHFSDAVDRAGEMENVAGCMHTALRLLATSNAPVVTAIHGVAAGGGIGLALVGDVILASPRAKFRMAYTAVGLSPDCGVSWLLPRLVGHTRALDLALTNRLVSAAEAETWGMVSRVVEGDLMSEAESLARTLAKGSAASLTSTKRLIWSSSTSTFADQLDREAASIAERVASADGVEGVDSFLAKRKPTFA